MRPFPEQVMEWVEIQAAGGHEGYQCHDVTVLLQ